MTDLAERDDTQARAAVSRIPLRNIWLLMLYASSLFRHHGRSMVAAENNPEEIPALVARILLHEVEQRLLRHLSMGYQTRRATLNRVRGRIDVLRTTSRQLLERAQVACQFQEMTLDTPRNRYVRSALEHLVPLLSNGPLAAQCRAMAINLRRRGIEGVCPVKVNCRQSHVLAATMRRIKPWSMPRSWHLNYGYQPKLRGKNCCQRRLMILTGCASCSRKVWRVSITSIFPKKTGQSLPEKS